MDPHNGKNGLLSISDPKTNHLDHTIVKVEVNSIEPIFPTKPERNPIEEVLSPKQTVIVHSGPFPKSIAQDHHDLMKTLVKELIELTKEIVMKFMKLPNVIELMKINKSIPNKERKTDEKEIVIEALNQLDTGLIGIIEILMGNRANVFSTGLPNFCSESSGF
ncbi:hypothetical protein DFH28DRAFT_933307 [Melampsora americana]|nr:hypothetical protein DFH28DRAFT_933307 [Melampsora americana]